jgi:hypothetical protein
VQELQNRFTVYDVFAVLIPGVIFLYFLAFTLDRAVGVRLFDWTGNVGDAALLLIFGYATGILLHALGKALIERPWRFIRGGQPTATLLTQRSNKLSASTKSDVLKTLDNAYGPSPLGEKDEGYTRMLEDRTYRAWKAIADGDAQAQRFLAEVHTMRAFAVAFLTLAIVTVVGALLYGDGGMTWKTHGTLVVVYGLLFVTMLWRMEDKAVTFARHVLSAFVESQQKKEAGGATPVSRSSRWAMVISRCFSSTE